jgi:ribonuclease-3
VKDPNELQSALGLVFRDPSLLERALVHSSYINENPGRVSGHNERLEFLGDAVLGWIVAEQLYRTFPDLTEGEMTRLRASLVRGETLARVARRIGLGDFLYMGKGEESSGGRDKPPNLAGAMEAVIAAVYLDCGESTARELVLDLLQEDLKHVIDRGARADYKSRLQERVQSRLQKVPVYRIIAEEGPDHAKLFTVEVMVAGDVLGRGSGYSKKQAEMEAARAALGAFTE